MVMCHQVPSEVLSLETRSAGYALTTFMNFAVSFQCSTLE